MQKVPLLLNEEDEAEKLLRVARDAQGIAASKEIVPFFQKELPRDSLLKIQGLNGMVATSGLSGGLP